MVFKYSSTHAFKRAINTVEVIDSISIGDSEVGASNCVRNLGAIFDKHMTMNEQVKSLCQKAAYGLYKIGKIRRILNQQTTEKLVHTLITSRLDY